MQWISLHLVFRWIGMSWNRFMFDDLSLKQCNAKSCWCVSIVHLTSFKAFYQLSFINILVINRRGEICLNGLNSSLSIQIVYAFCSKQLSERWRNPYGTIGRCRDKAFNSFQEIIVIIYNFWIPIEL